MLHVEEPDPGGAGEQQRRALHEQELLPADQPAERRDDHASARSVPRTLLRSRGRMSTRDQARPISSDPERPEPEHDERIAEEPVAEPAPPRRGVVLVDGERLDVADAPPVEVAGGRVMDGVLVAPPQTACRRARPASPERCIRALRAQERAVRAVVEDDERAEQERPRDQRQPAREPRREREHGARRADQADVRGR